MSKLNNIGTTDDRSHTEKQVNAVGWSQLTQFYVSQSSPHSIYLLIANRQRNYLMA
jgi:hypothetical protein